VAITRSGRGGKGGEYDRRKKFAGAERGRLYLTGGLGEEEPKIYSREMGGGERGGSVS